MSAPLGNAGAGRRRDPVAAAAVAGIGFLSLGLVVVERALVVVVHVVAGLPSGRVVGAVVPVVVVVVEAAEQAEEQYMSAKEPCCTASEHWRVNAD